MCAYSTDLTYRKPRAAKSPLFFGRSSISLRKISQSRSLRAKIYAKHSGQIEQNCCFKRHIVLFGWEYALQLTKLKEADASGGIAMKVIIATDGSDYSIAAIEECCRNIIRPANTEVLVVSVYENSYPIMAEPFAVSAEYYQHVEDAVRELCQQHLADAEKMIRDKFPDLKLSSEVLTGPPDQQIVERAREWNADMIVVGSHGRGFWGRLLGSVSNGVVHHAPCSVLVVRKH